MSLSDRHRSAGGRGTGLLRGVRTSGEEAAGEGTKSKANSRISVPPSQGPEDVSKMSQRVDSLGVSLWGGEFWGKYEEHTTSNQSVGTSTTKATETEPENHHKENHTIIVNVYTPGPVMHTQMMSKARVHRTTDAPPTSPVAFLTRSLTSPLLRLEVCLSRASRRRPATVMDCVVREMEKTVINHACLVSECHDSWAYTPSTPHRRAPHNSRLSHRPARRKTLYTRRKHTSRLPRNTPDRLSRTR